MAQSAYYLRSFGCQMNEHDAERIRAALESIGLRRAEAPEDAEVLLYNSCTVRRSADDRLAGHLSLAGRLRRERPGTRVIVTGCLPQTAQEDLFQRFPFVDLALGTQSLHLLSNEVANLLQSDDDTPAHVGCFAESDVLSGDLPTHRERPYQAWVQIMSGCTHGCTYCIVPAARGPERSRQPQAIVEEVRGLVADGVVEVTLLGQNVNAYGRDLAPSPSAGGTAFPALLYTLAEVSGLQRLRFMTSHPMDLSDELIEAMKALPVLCEHLHLPVQSGSDAVLHAMRRGYTVEWYLDRVAALRQAVPDISLTTDLIVGFPGETDEDFKATVDLVQQARFDGAFTFVYSPRPHTAAASFPEQVPDTVKRERVAALIALTQQQALQNHQRFVGQSLQVLIEGPSRRGQGWRGRTRHNLTVNCTGTAEPGSLVDVLITEASSTTLRGCM